MAAAAAGTGGAAGGGSSAAGAAPLPQTRGAVTTRGRSANKVPASTRGLGLDFLNTSKGGGAGGGGIFDVLMTPSFPPDELSMMLDVLNGFGDTPRF